MEYVAETKQLKKAMSTLMNCVEKPGGLQAFQCVMLSFKRYSVTAYTSNRVFEAQLEMPGYITPGSADMVVSVNCEKLYKAVKIVKGPRVEIEVSENAITVDGNEVPLFKDEMWPCLLLNSDIHEWHRSCMPSIKNAIKQCLHCIQKVDSIYAFSGVALQYDSTTREFAVVACDGDRMGFQSFIMVNDCNESRNCIIPGRTAVAIPKCFDLIRGISLNIDKVIVEGRWDNEHAIIISSRILEGKFPNWRSIIPPAEEMNMLSLKGNEVRDFVSYANSICAKKDLNYTHIKSHETDLSLNVWADGDMRKRTFWAQEYNKEGIDISVFTPRLNDALKNMSDKVTMYAFPSNKKMKPFVLLDGETGYRELITQTYLPEDMVAAEQAQPAADQQSA